LPYTIGLDARKIQDIEIGTYIRNLIRHLARIDTENRYVLIARPQDRDSFRDLPENFRPQYDKSPVYSARELLGLSWQLWRWKLDLYHSTHYVLPAWVGSPVVLTVYDIVHLLYPEFLPSRLAFLYAQRMLSRSLSRSDRIIAVTQNTRTDLVKHFDVDGRKVEVIYNGVEDAFRKKLAPEELERWRRDLGLERSYVLFVGNPAGNPKKRKNLDTVIQAYARAREISPFDAQLVCVGDRPGTEFKLRQRAESLGIGDRVRLLGQVAPEALPALYQGATLFLYPTLYEGFSQPVSEAMASGVAVITSNTSALKEIAEGYAHLVDPLDIEGMAKAIAHTLSDSEHRNSLAKLGLRRAEDFRWSQTARRTLEIYLSAIQSSPSRKIATLPDSPGSPVRPLQGPAEGGS
jgi:glycosyltransferase involved in cell wall biosynthesis